MADTELQRAVKLFGARPAGVSGSWFATDCPKCGVEGSMALTVRGANCRSELCGWAGSLRAAMELKRLRG